MWSSVLLTLLWISSNMLVFRISVIDAFGLWKYALDRFWHGPVTVQVMELVSPSIMIKSWVGLILQLETEDSETEFQIIIGMIYFTAISIINFWAWECHVYVSTIVYSHDNYIIILLCAMYSWPYRECKRDTKNKLEPGTTDHLPLVVGIFQADRSSRITCTIDEYLTVTMS